jgi:hypothetical protein
MDYIIKISSPIVDRLDEKLDAVVTTASTLRSDLVATYTARRNDVISKVRGYSSAISEQVSQFSQTQVRVKVEESVRQAPEIVRSISNKAVSLTKQGLEISIGQENTASVINTVITHTPKFVSSLLAEPAVEETGTSAVAAH